MSHLRAGKGSPEAQSATPFIPMPSLLTNQLLGSTSGLDIARRFREPAMKEARVGGRDWDALQVQQLCSGLRTYMQEHVHSKRL
jgi:hypothetical protein